jgi:F420-dependent oxidoreductase-like protein
MSSIIDFGIFSQQAGLSYQDLRERAVLAESLGYHSIWLVDHFFSPSRPDADQLECLTALAALAVQTSRIRLGPMVICNSFRHPGLLAKMLSTIDNISGGRLEIGIGAGWLADEYRAYGYEFPRTGLRLKQLEESLRILRQMFTGQRSTFKGEFYSLDDAPNSPKPIQKPYPPITIGGGGEKVLLRLVAQYADRWNCPAAYGDSAGKLEVLRAHCREVGRDPGSITVSEQILVCVGRTQAEVDEKWAVAQKKFKPFSRNTIKGTPSEAIAQIRQRVDHGVKLLVMLFGDDAPPSTLEFFAREIMPAFA